MPCLNEARTVGTCVRKALDYLDQHQIKGEVIVADNGSTDGSQAIALGLGALRCVGCSERIWKRSARGHRRTALERHEKIYWAEAGISTLPSFRMRVSIL